VGCLLRFNPLIGWNLQGVSYETQDGLYDVAWSESHENQLATGSGDGSIRLWDVMLNVRVSSLFKVRAPAEPSAKMYRICLYVPGTNIHARFFL